MWRMKNWKKDQGSLLGETLLTVERNKTSELENAVESKKRNRGNKERGKKRADRPAK